MNKTLAWFLYIRKYHIRQICGRVKNWKTVSYSPNFSSQIFTHTPKMYLSVCTDCSVFAKFFLANSLYSLLKFPPTKSFPCTIMYIILYTQFCYTCQSATYLLQWSHTASGSTWTHLGWCLPAQEQQVMYKWNVTIENDVIYVSLPVQNAFQT